MPSSPDIDVVNINGKSFTLQDSSDEPDGKKASPQTQVAAVITQDGKTFTAILQSASAVVLEAASTTLTVSPGAALALDGEIFSVPIAGSGSVLVHDGTTITLKPTTISTTDPPNPTTLPSHAGQHLSAFDLGTSIIVIADGTTITLADGAQTTLGKDTISAASTGGAVVVNGTSTLIASSTRTNDADPSASGDDGVEATADTGSGPESEGSASGGQSRVGMSVLLLLGSWVGVVWL
jgi:hypothetical protein